MFARTLPLVILLQAIEDPSGSEGQHLSTLVAVERTVEMRLSNRFE